MTGPGDYGASDYSDYGPKSQRLSSDYDGSKDFGRNSWKKRQKNRENRGKMAEKPEKTQNLGFLGQNKGRTRALCLGAALVFSSFRYVVAIPTPVLNRGRLALYPNPGRSWLRFRRPVLS